LIADTFGQLFLTQSHFKGLKMLSILLRILFDSVVLSSIIYMLRGEDTPGWLTMIFVVVGMAVGNSICAQFLAPILGILYLVPIVLLDCLILMYFCSLTIKQALVTLGILVAYHVVMGFVLLAIAHFIQ
jgi:hypothetical protein